MRRFFSSRRAFFRLWLARRQKHDQSTTEARPKHATTDRSVSGFLQLGRQVLGAIV
jgi:hypothetical protein